MATQRYISTSFWDDPWITTLDPSEKLLYLYLMTNTLTNISGVYKIAVRRICFDTGFNSDTVGHIMTKFENARKAHRIDEYIALPSWPKHQNYEIRSKIKEGIVSCLKELPKECLIELAKIGYKFDLQPIFDTLSIPYTYPSNYSDSDLDSKYDIDSELEETPNESACVSKPISEKIGKKSQGSLLNVLLSDKEVDTLKNEYGDRSAISAIEYLSLYKAEKNYKTKSDYLTIRRWVIEAVRKKEGITVINKKAEKFCTHPTPSGPCGGRIKGSACIVCFTNYGIDGEEV
jgi:hypothetical protein